MKILFENDNRMDLMALLLRTGLGAVFFIGGWNKLYQLLDTALVDKILASYYGPSGYVNEFFSTFLFVDGPLAGILTPWNFLTALSIFELISGFLLLVGWMVRPLALIYALLLWTFVMALPVITVEGIAPDISTYRSPAILVQIRDIGLSGLFFVLFNLGAGKFSIERPVFGGVKIRKKIHWDALGLLLRISLALPLIVGGVFTGMDHIANFATPWWILLLLGLAILAGLTPRITGTVLVAVMFYYIASKINLDASLISNLNSFKRELAFLTAGIVFAVAGGGGHFSAQKVSAAFKNR